MPFENFIAELNDAIPSIDRQLATLRPPGKHSIHRYLTTGTPSAALLAFLDRNAEHIHPNLVADSISPERFYKGFGESWGPLVDGLDAERDIVQDILLEVILDPPASSLTGPSLYLVHGYAGSGKSIALRRAAWNAAADHGKLILWLRPEGDVDLTSLRELSQLANERLFLFVDDARDRLDKLADFHRSASTENLPITVIFAVRTNEWNVLHDQHQPNADGTYEVGPLRNREINRLLELLRKNKCLGHLATLGDDDQVEFFRERGRPTNPRRTP